MATVREQLRSNLVAIVSLVVAFAALGYNTWRNERTEHNRNVRAAGVELLKEIGSLQQIVFYVRFTVDVEHESPSGRLRMGWVDVFTINDLAAVMPPAVADEAGQLRNVWESNSNGLAEPKEEIREVAFRRIDLAIEELRQATLASLRALD